MPLADSLLRLGLAPKEAAVYVALLELGTASVQAVARRAGVVRPTTYVILEHLAEKGLVAKATGQDAKKMLFRAEDPSRLSSFLEEQRRSIEGLQREAEQLVPELRSAYARGEEYPRVRLFEGKDGLKDLQRQFIHGAAGDVVGISSRESREAVFSRAELVQDFAKVRVEARARSRRLEISPQGTDVDPGEERELLRETRWLPPLGYPIHASFAAHGPLLSIVSLRGKIIGVLIEHADIADSFRAIFESMWVVAARNPRPPPTP